jgi:hypothetical protein
VAIIKWIITGSSLEMMEKMWRMGGLPSRVFRFARSDFELWQDVGGGDGADDGIHRLTDLF